MSSTHIQFKSFVFRTVSLFALCTVLVSACFSSRGSTKTPKGNMGGEEFRLRRNITEHAENYLGVKYHYGGENPRSGFDCSGFTSFVMDEYGVQLERTSSAQSKMGKRVPLERSKPGDLVFFSRKGRVFHVSLVVANTDEGVEVIHATSSRGVVRENISKSSYWSPKKKFVQDVIGEIY